MYTLGLKNESVANEIEDFHTDDPLEDHLLQVDIQDVEYSPLDSEDEFEDDEEESVQAGKISEESAAEFRNGALIFYTGFAGFKLNKKLKCDNCANYMIDKSSTLKKEAILIKLRAYKTVKSISEFGNLTVPTANFESTVQIIHSYFEKEFPEIQFENKLLEKLLENVSKIAPFKNYKCEKSDHKIGILKFVLIGLIKFSLKKSNKFLTKSKNRKIL